MTRAVLSFGANLGDAAGTLRTAVDALGPALVRSSALFRTPPWGGVEQDDFVNATVLADDPGRDAAGWLTFCREQEAAAQRVRDVRWGPRTLDVDVIAVWDGDRPVRSGDPELTLPHRARTSARSCWSRGSTPTRRRSCRGTAPSTHCSVTCRPGRSRR
ncbi:hypothetical protein MTP03_04690 [Tsukamurella sp. PLM1]|nr:hypothetical protein MTP03_04690 [Tsukamurella sp. PLM1]